MGQPKILVVDDEEDVLETIRYRLEHEGYEVVAAVNGWEAIGAARLAKPDLVVLDVMLPKENGYRVSRTFREDEAAGVYPKRLPVLLLTARDLSTDGDREKMFMEFADADEVIYKPFDMDYLVRRVQELLSVGAKTADPDR